MGKKYPGAEIVCGTMDEFCRDLEQEDLSGVPVIRQDLADTWIHGVGSYPGQVRAVRQVRRAMNVLEEQYRREKETLSEAQRDQAEGLIRECYENLMLFGEHTWGLDVKTWMDPTGPTVRRLSRAEGERPGETDGGFLEGAGGPGLCGRRMPAADSGSC